MEYGVGLTRTVHLNMTAHPANITPSRAGHSIGRWDGDTLVVDTVGFVPGSLAGYLPHSDKLHVVERFTLNPATLELTRGIVAEDPVYFVDKYVDSDSVLPADAPFKVEACKELAPEYQQTGRPTGDNNMRQFFRLVSLVLGLAVFGDFAHAHHSQAGIFDSRKTIEVTGVVKSVSWRNPHGQILLSVKDEKGVETIWDAETASISILRNRGVDGSSIRVGDRVTIAGSPSMRARPEILARSVLLPNGNEFTFGSANAYFAAGKAGRLVGGAKIAGDVAAAKAKADGLFRVWSTIMSDPAAFPMFKGGYPLTAAGKAGLAKWNPRNNILLKCGTKGTPLIMISPLPMDFSKEGDKIIMRLEEYDSVRTIHMNPKAVAPAAHTLFGFSRGRWEGTTLVVETDHIAAGYFDHEGTPQSDQIKTVERFIPNADYSRLDYTLTTTDPVNFTKPFELKRYFVWKPENRVHPYECLDRFEPGK